MSDLLALDLSVSYRNKPAVLDGVKFSMAPGEIFGLIGESGSGKSTIALAILRLLDTRGASISGTIQFAGRDLMQCRERELREVRGLGIGLVPQSPLSALNPALRFEAHFREAWRAHSKTPWRSVRTQVIDLLRQLDLPADDAFLRRYPHQVSVGQAQRILIAMSMLHRPSLLIADEPTSALDPNSQQGIIDLLARLNREFAMAILYISHDLSSVAALCARVGILRDGRLTACGPPEEVLRTTRSAPYAPAQPLLFSVAAKVSSAP
jgi:ABC-type glutathione transport system ATPase component